MTLNAEGSRSRNKVSPKSMRDAKESSGLDASGRSARKKPLCCVKVSGRVWNSVPPTFSLMIFISFVLDFWDSPLNRRGGVEEVSSSSSRPRRTAVSEDGDATDADNEDDEGEEEDGEDEEDKGGNDGDAISVDTNLLLTSNMSCSAGFVFVSWLGASVALDDLAGSVVV